MSRLISGALGLIAAALVPLSAFAQENPLGDCRVGEATWVGDSSWDGTARTGYYLVAVRVVCDDATLYADEVRWNADRVTATGNVLLEQRGLRVYAERIDLDRRTRLGTFHRVTGWARLADDAATRNPFGALEPDVQFAAERIDRIGPRLYQLTDGWFSTCAQPTPRWSITTTSGTITLGERLLARNAVLRVKGMPVFYTPVIYYPLGSDERSTGFLMPSYGASSAHGSAVSNAFFLVLGRSHDLTLYHTWFTKAGQSAGAEYRIVTGPGSGGQAQFTMIDQRAAARRTYTVNGSANQRLGRGFYVIGRSNYTTNQLTRQLFQQNPYEFSHREQYLGATLTGNLGRYRISAAAERRDIYSGTTFAERQGQAPVVRVAMSEAPIGRSRVYLGAAGEAAYFIRQTDISNIETDRSLARVDVAPTIRAPLSRLAFLSVTTAATFRLTHWSRSTELTEEGRTLAGSLTRQLFNVRTDIVGPVFAKIWTPSPNGYADRFKHVIEPRVSIAWLSGFDRFDDVIQIDATDQLVGNSTTITYALVNRLLARRVQAGGRGAVREILAVSVSQSRYSKPLAGAFDTQYHTATVNTFSPVQVTATTSPADGTSARFQMYIDATVRKITSYAASAAVGRDRTQLAAGWSKRQFIPGLRGYDTPESASHFLNLSVTSRSTGGRVGVSYATNVDLRQPALLQQRLVVHLNAQCCGVSFDYQTLRQGVSGSTVLPADRRFGVSLSLAGLGSFSNPFGSFGDNSGRR